MTYNHDDPFEAAANAELQAPEVWGAVSVDAWFCVLQKGFGAVAFDPQHHKANERRTQIEILIAPLAETRMQYQANRKMLAESREWAGIVLKSLKELGINSPRELQNRYAHVEFVGTGRSYESNGATKEATTFQFLGVWDSYEACLAAYYQARGITPDTESSAPAAPAASPTDNERATALQFVRALIAQANGDPVMLAKKMSPLPMITKYFTADSPEVQQAIMDYVIGTQKQAA